MPPRSVCAAVVLLALSAACAPHAPRELRDRAYRYSACTPLPTPDTHGTMPLDEALATRRSTRAFATKLVPLSLIGQMLWSAQGVTSPDGKRTAPSAGGLYPLELYVVTPTHVMRYQPAGHCVETRTTHDVRGALRAAALGQAVVAQAPAIMVIAANPARTRAKYGARADAFVLLEAGHATQNVLLEATERGLAAAPIGGIDAAKVRHALALTAREHVEYLVPFGFKP